MRLNRRDSKAYDIYRPREESNALGQVKRFYDVPPEEFIIGNLQPRGEQLHEPRRDTEYGIEIDYDYVMYATGETSLNPFDRIGRGKAQYEVRLAQTWPNYRRILLRGVAQ